MRAFIPISLTEAPAFTYQQPILHWVKETSSNIVTVLDIDAFSNESLVNYACGLMQEAEDLAIYFKLEKEDVALGSGLKIVEEIIRGGKANLVLLEGIHKRLSAIFSSRPEINFKAAATQAELKSFLTAFLQETA